MVQCLNDLSIFCLKILSCFFNYLMALSKRKYCVLKKVNKNLILAWIGIGINNPVFSCIRSNNVIVYGNKNLSTLSAEHNFGGVRIYSILLDLYAGTAVHLLLLRNSA